MSDLTIVHLYPRELGINGDVGNVTALRRRAEWRGMPVRVVDVGPGDALPGTAHLVHIGSGPASSRAPLHDDVARLAPTLREWAAAGVPFLAIAAGWQLLGREVIDLDRTVRAGAKIFPSAASSAANGWSVRSRGSPSSARWRGSSTTGRRRSWIAGSPPSPGSRAPKTASSPGTSWLRTCTGRSCR